MIFFSAIFNYWSIKDSKEQRMKVFIGKFLSVKFSDGVSNKEYCFEFTIFPSEKSIVMLRVKGFFSLGSWSSWCCLRGYTNRCNTAIPARWYYHSNMGESTTSFITDDSGSHYFVYCNQL